MPFPNEHSARVREPGGFEPGSFRRMKQDSDGKPFVIIVGRLKGKTESTAQSFRYPKDQWTPRAAKRHAEGHKAKGFEAAKAASLDAFVIGMACDGASPAGAATKGDDDKLTRRYTKDLIRVGTFTHPHEDWTLDVTGKRLQHWLDQFHKMRGNGRDIEVVADHLPGEGTRAEKIRGYMVDAFVEGDRLVGVLEMSGQKGIDLAEAVKNVSVEIDKSWTDGEDNTYDDVITAVAIVEKPIVSGQEPFRRAASVAKAGDMPVFIEGEPEPIEDGDMDKQLLSLIGKLGDTDDVTEDNAVMVLKQFGEGAKSLAEEIVTLKADLTAEKAKKASGKMPEVDEDVLEDIGETRTAELSLLVAEGRITPAVAKALKPILIGESGKRITFGLSTKAAKAFGLDAPLAKQVLAALKLNNPVELREKTGRQTLALVRDDPEETEPSVDPELKSRADDAYGSTGTDGK